MSIPPLVSRLAILPVVALPEAKKSSVGAQLETPLGPSAEIPQPKLPLAGAPVPRTQLAVASTPVPRTQLAVASVVLNSVKTRAVVAISSAEHALTMLGAGQSPSKDVFIDALTRVREESPEAFALVVAGFSDHSAEVMRLLSSGVDPIAGVHDVDLRQHGEVVDRLFLAARDAYDGLQRLRREIEVIRPASEPNARLNQAFELLQQFPDLCQDVWEDAEVPLTGFPPQAEGAPHWVALAGDAWSAAERREQIIKGAALVALGIAATLVGAATGGAGAALIAGAIVGAASSGEQVARAMDALEGAKLAEIAGIGSAQTTESRSDDLTGAWAAFAVNVLSAGVTARVPTNVVLQVVQPMGMGAASGLVSTAMHPGVWKNENPLGMLVEATVVSAAFSLGAAAAVKTTAAALVTGKRIAFAISRENQLRPGAEIVVGQKVGKVISADGDNVRLAVDGAELTVRVNRLQLIKRGLSAVLAKPGRVERATVSLQMVNESKPFHEAPIAIGTRVTMLRDGHATEQRVLTVVRDETVFFDDGTSYPIAELQTNSRGAEPAVITPQALRIYRELLGQLPRSEEYRVQPPHPVYESGDWRPASQLPLTPGMKLRILDQPSEVVSVSQHDAKVRRIAVRRADGTESTIYDHAGWSFARHEGELFLTLGETKRAGTLRRENVTLDPSRVRWEAVSLGPSSGHYLVAHDPTGLNGPVILPPQTKFWDHNGAFASLDAIRQAPQITRGNRVASSERAIFSAHGSPSGFEGLSNARAAELIVDQVVAANRVLPPAQRVRAVLLDSCSQGDHAFFGVFGSTNAQRLQALVDARLEQLGITEPLTVFASDKPGVLFSTWSHTEFNGRPIMGPVPIPAADQDPSRFLLRSDYMRAAAIPVGASVLLLGYAALLGAIRDSKE
jgi:hypothetical protein